MSRPKKPPCGNPFVLKDNPRAYMTREEFRRFMEGQYPLMEQALKRVSLLIDNEKLSQILSGGLISHIHAETGNHRLTVVRLKPEVSSLDLLEFLNNESGIKTCGEKQELLLEALERAEKKGLVELEDKGFQMGKNQGVL